MVVAAVVVTSLVRGGEVVAVAAAAVVLVVRRRSFPRHFKFEKVNCHFRRRINLLSPHARVTCTRAPTSPPQHWLEFEFEFEEV